MHFYAVFIPKNKQIKIKQAILLQKNACFNLFFIFLSQIT